MCHHRYCHHHQPPVSYQNGYFLLFSRNFDFFFSSAAAFVNRSIRSDNVSFIVTNQMPFTIVDTALTSIYIKTHRAIHTYIHITIIYIDTFCFVDRIPNYRMSECSLLGFSGCHCSISVFIYCQNECHLQTLSANVSIFGTLNDDTHIRQFANARCLRLLSISIFIRIPETRIIEHYWYVLHTNFIQFDWTWIKDIRFIIIKLFVSTFSIWINHRFLNKWINSLEKRWTLSLHLFILRSDFFISSFFYRLVESAKYFGDKSWFVLILSIHWKMLFVFLMV